VVPALHNVASSSESSATRLEAAITWIRRDWDHRAVLSRPNGFVGSDQFREAAIGRVNPRSIARLGVKHLDHGVGVVTDAVEIPTMATTLGLVGHTCGARACALVSGRGQVRVRALAAIAGMWDESDAVNALIDAKDPTLLVAGSAELPSLIYRRALWTSLPVPKHQAAWQSLGHSDWFGRQGGIQFCDPKAVRAQCPVRWLTASELLVGFMTRVCGIRAELMTRRSLVPRSTGASEGGRIQLLLFKNSPTGFVVSNPLTGSALRYSGPMPLDASGKRGSSQARAKLI
jgi:hypothetical protein